MEQELEEERRQRAAAVAARKKIEGDFAAMQQQVDLANKLKEDALKQAKKLQVLQPCYLDNRFLKRINTAKIINHMSRFL